MSPLQISVLVLAAAAHAARNAIETARHTMVRFMWALPVLVVLSVAHMVQTCPTFKQQRRRMVCARAHAADQAESLGSFLGADFWPWLW